MSATLLIPSPGSALPLFGSRTEEEEEDTLQPGLWLPCLCLWFLVGLSFVLVGWLVCFFYFLFILLVIFFSFLFSCPLLQPYLHSGSLVMIQVTCLSSGFDLPCLTIVKSLVKF